VDVALWGRTAENASQYLKKGRQVYIEGRLQLDTWDDKQTGQKRSKLRVVGETMQFLGSREGGGGGGGDYDAPPRSAAPPARDSGGARPAKPAAQEEEDDIPF